MNETHDLNIVVVVVAFRPPREQRAEDSDYFEWLIHGAINLAPLRGARPLRMTTTSTRRGTTTATAILFDYLGQVTSCALKTTAGAA